jgi:hypothetical protein
MVRRPSFAWGNVPETLNVALTLPELALKVEADADITENNNETDTIAVMSPDRISTAGLDNVDPSLVVEVRLSDLIPVTSGVLSAAWNKLQRYSNIHILAPRTELFGN